MVDVIYSDLSVRVTHARLKFKSPFALEAARQATLHLLRRQLPFDQSLKDYFERGLHDQK